MAQVSSVLSSDVNALTGPLQMVTLCSNNLEEVRKLYVQNIGLEIKGPFDIEGSMRAKLRTYWDIPASIEFQVFHLFKPEDVPHPSVGIRVIIISEDTEMLHDHSAYREIGPYSIGFSTKNIKDLKELLKSQGQTSLPTTHIKEAHITNRKEEDRKMALFSGPDNVRLSILQEDSTGIQNTIFITDRPDEEIEFYTHVLGMQLTSDFQGVSKKSYQKDDSVKVIFRSSTLTSKASHEKSVHLLSYDSDEEQERKVPFRLPQKGVVMYTFETKDIGEILARAHAKEVKVYRTPRKLIDPIYGEAIAMTLLSPTGFIVEVYTPA